MLQMHWSATFQVAWVFDGDSFNINGWFVDDISLSVPNPGCLSGTVTLNGGSGQVSDVLVSTDDGHQIHPEENGEYLLSVPAGVHQVTAALEGYQTLVVPDVVVEPGEITNLDLVLEPLDAVPGEEIPPVTELTGNYPNPFNPSTNIAFALAEPARNVTIELFDITGRKVNSLVNSALPAGYHQVLWHSDDDRGNPVASGIYFYRLWVDHRVIAVRRLVLLR